jgi:hypothetical protein
MNTSTSGDGMVRKQISRRDFLKLICAVGDIFMLSTLIPITKVLGINATSNKNISVNGGLNNVGPDGVSFLYPTKPGGFVWFMNAKYPLDSHFEIGGGSSHGKLIKNNDGSWTANDPKKVKFNLNLDPNYKDAIGGCKMSYKDSISRGYTYNKNDLDNVELTGFFNVHKPTKHDGIYLRGPCNHHGESDTICCEEFSYDCETDCNSITQPSKVKHTKQSPNTYYDDPAGIKLITPNVLLAGHGWFGIKYVHIILSRDPDDPKVKLQQWMNLNGDGKSWIKVNEIIDSRAYKWGPKAICDGQDYEVGAWGAPRMVYKWYDGKVDFKWFSCRQIIPTQIVFKFFK